ncbi:hypothetical protein PVAP13_9NG484014 [Panicum virgatum]|uniref:Uncharacterized protein n=1 Tax=Panicum virgatum TaxID=38727 RepID=A0A8T0MSF8_PANVG|nr:hypothetical protein PVAP13_9NG484014 [Panicum virgatum]
MQRANRKAFVADVPRGARGGGGGGGGRRAAGGRRREARGAERNGEKREARPAHLDEPLRAARRAGRARGNGELGTRRRPPRTKARKRCGGRELRFGRERQAPRRERYLGLELSCRITEVTQRVKRAEGRLVAVCLSSTHFF